MEYVINRLYTQKLFSYISKKKNCINLNFIFFLSGHVKANLRVILLKCLKCELIALICFEMELNLNKN